MSEPTMTEVIAAHPFAKFYYTPLDYGAYCDSTDCKWTQQLSDDAPSAQAAYAEHVAERLTAAGFGHIRAPQS